MNVISKGLVRMLVTPAMLLSPFNRLRKAGKTPEIFMPPTQKVAYFLGVRSIRKATTEGDNPTIRRINTWGNTNIRDAAKIAQRMN